MSGPIRILAVDDHPLLREGVAALLASQPDMTLIAEASNGREALEQFRAHRPDITLMDLQMPEMNGVDAIMAICGEFPAARIIVLTTTRETSRCCARSKPAREPTCSRVYSGKNFWTRSAWYTPGSKL